MEAAKKAERFSEKLKILFIDDENDVREMAEEMLVSFGHDVTVFDNGADAVRHYRQAWESTDLVIFDMVMPEMDGRETFAALRGINPDIRAILISGFSLNEEAQAILNEGARAFVQKPFGFEEMRAAIGNAVIV